MSNNNQADAPSGLGQGGGGKARNSTTSSGGSSNAKLAGSIFNAGYQDEAKLLASIKQFTTLEGMGEETQEEAQQVQSIVSSLGQSSGGRKGKIDSSVQQSVFNKNFLRVIEKQVIQKLYQINHLLLTYQAVTTPLFHLIRLFSFLQVIFNVFYGINIRNEFLLPDDVIEKQNSIINGGVQEANPNISVSTNTQQYSGWDELDEESQEVKNVTKVVKEVNLNSIRIDEYLKFSNFQFYLFTEDSQTQFLTLYGVLSGLLLLTIAILLFSSTKYFRESKNEDVKDGTGSLLMKICSMVITMYLFVFQVPLLTVLFQGYLCDETNDVNPGLTCSSSLHTILILTSTLMIIVYILFVFAETLLFASNSFEIVIPWASFERELAIIRQLIKFIISLSLIFDKSCSAKGEINLALAALYAYVVVKRMKEAIIFEDSVFYACFFYEILGFWVYITVSVHLLTETQLSITSVALIFLIGITLAITLILYQVQKKFGQITTKDTTRQFTRPIDYMIYIYRMHRLIESDDLNSKMILSGKLMQHMNHCMKEDCTCVMVMETLDDIQIQKDIMKRDEELQNLEDDLENKSGKSQSRIMLGDGANPQQSDLFIDQSTGQIASGLNLLPNSRSNVSGKKPSRLNLSETAGAGGEGTQEVNWQQQDQLRLTGSMKRPSFKEQNEKKKEKESITNKVIVRSWLQQKKRLQKIEETIELMQKISQDPQKLHTQWYRMLSIYISEGIERFPNSIDLRIINGFVQKTKLSNEFKAIFEMMRSELASPSIYEKFVIFRKKIEIEQQLIKQHQKNITKIGVLDVVNVFKYEKWFSKYVLYEYLATYSAQCFWKELLQKQVDAQILQYRGAEISLYYEYIQKIAVELQKIYPDEIRFLFRYGNFLLQIIHSEYDALENYMKAQLIYVSKLSKKQSQYQDHQQMIFGENSGSAIVIISASSSQIGTIIHTNQEIEQVLGYKRKELIGRNVNCLMPRVIGKAHDHLVQRYFETAQPRVIENLRQLFGTSKEGYLREVQLLVKVYPQVNEKIVFVGFIQRHHLFEDMEKVKPEFEKYDQEYIITDKEGNITNVTEGLFMDMGLHSKFFNYTDSIFQQMFNISKVCQEITDHDVMDQLQGEGVILNFDTSKILNTVEIESLNSDEIIEVKSNLGQYQCYVQMKRLVIHPQYCTIQIFRVIILSKNELGSSMMRKMLPDATTNSDAIGSGNQEKAEVFSDSDNTHGSTPQDLQQSMSSVSSATSNSMSFNKIIKDFKKTLTERKTPKNLLYLNRVMVLIFLLTIILSSVDFGILSSTVSILNRQTQRTVKTEKRNLGLVQLVSNVRSLINVANGLEFERYEGQQLAPFDRFVYLSQLIQTQAQDLHETHEYLSSERVITEKELLGFEYEPVPLYRLDGRNEISNYSQPYRVALLTYLNQILALNATDRWDMIMPQRSLFLNPTRQDLILESPEELEDIHRSIYFLMVNGFRSLLVKSDEANERQHKIKKTDVQLEVLLIIMFIVIAIIFGFFAAMLYEIWIIERNKVEIMTLYSYLHFQEIKDVYSTCDKFMTNLNRGSLLQDLEINKEEDPQELTMTQDITTPITVTKPKDNNNNAEDMSDEEREAELYRTFMQKKRKQNKNARERNRQSTKVGHEIYSNMIKNTFDQIKNINRKVEAQQQLTGTAGMSMSMGKRSQQKRDQAKQDNIAKKKATKRGTKQLDFQDDQESNRQKKKHRSKRQKKNDAKDDVEKGGFQSDGTESSNEEEDEKAAEERRARKEKLEAQRSKLNEMEMNMQEQEQRQKEFRDSIKKNIWGKIMLTAFLGACFLAYFIEVQVQYVQFKSDLNSLVNAMPQFLDRYRYSILSYSFARERILNNNSLSSFQKSHFDDFDLDTEYLTKSIELETRITQLKSNYPAIISPMIDILKIMDSEKFCAYIVKDNKTKKNETDGVTDIKFNPELAKTIPYQNLVPQIQLQIAAENGDLKLMQQVRSTGQDMNAVNYDRNTALHIASYLGQTEIVRYLISIGVKINLENRWGSTALTYGKNHPVIGPLLRQAGGIVGRELPYNQKLADTYRSISNLKEDEYRQYYAARDGNLVALQILKNMGFLRPDIQDKNGRSPLHIAAGEDKLDAIKYLMNNGGNPYLKGIRGRNVIDEARREGRTDIVVYLRQRTDDQNIHNFCHRFGEGLLEKGIQQTLGHFQKRFTDLQIRIQAASTYDQRLTLLNPPNSKRNSQQLGVNSLNVTTLQSYFSAQELYFHEAIKKAIEVMELDSTVFIEDYSQSCLIIFLVFLAYQIIVLTIVRERIISKLKNDIFKSRGILNLIPDNFFETNRTRVESLIKKLKD